MTTLTGPARVLAAARVGRITALVEATQPVRLTFAATRIVLQTFLVACLWRALYSQTTTSAGLNVGQAVSYAVLAVLISRQGGVDRFTSRDTVFQHVQEGSILYWFLRPMSARRYYLVRAAGDQAYALVWVLVGYLVCLATGLVTAPASAPAAGAFLVAFGLGQVTQYYLTLAMDLICFWAVRNSMAILIFQFMQNLLAGVFAPLWFFPGWFRAVDAWLPFQGIVNIPLSLYIGRIPVAQAWSVLAIQLAWCAALAVLTAVAWRRAGRRVSVQGG